MIELVKEYTGLDFMEADTLEKAKEMAKSVGVDADACISWGKVISEVFDARVEEHLIQPTLVMDMPRDISPLAKTHRSNPRLVEHFDAYVAGMEMAAPIPNFLIRWSKESVLKHNARTGKPETTKPRC